MVTKKMTPTSPKTIWNVLPLGGPKFQATFNGALSSVPGHRPEPEAYLSASANALSTEPWLPPAEWQDAEYRHAAMEASIEAMVAWQVRVNREERGMTQAELASAMGTGQSAISKLEDPEGGDVQLSTLVRAAHAFDCALLVRFVDYTEFAAQTADVRPERLYAEPFGPPAKKAKVRMSAKKVAHDSLNP